ncbi:MAG: TatD family hydrolase [bacterium]
MFVDTHAHIFMSEFDADRDSVVKRASEGGVGIILDVGIDIETSRMAIENSRRYETVRAAAGFHPHDASLFNAAEFEKFIAENRDEIIALGEFGLDFYRDLSPRHIQKNALKEQISIALRCNLPLIIHCRKAHNELFNILNEFSRSFSGVMHCFSGGINDLKRSLDLGFHISIAGPLTYPKSHLAELVKLIPPDRLLLETDSPYLPPQPFRGKRNEPLYLINTAGMLADILGVKIFQVRDLTTENACRLFSISK